MKRWRKKHTDIDTHAHSQPLTHSQTSKSYLPSGPWHPLGPSRRKKKRTAKVDEVAPSSLFWLLNVPYWKCRHENTSDKKWQYWSRVPVECFSSVFSTYCLESTKGTSAVKKLVGRTSISKHYPCTSMPLRSLRERQKCADHSFEGWWRRKYIWATRDTQEWGKRSAESVNAMKKRTNKKSHSTEDHRRHSVLESMKVQGFWCLLFCSINLSCLFCLFYGAPAKESKSPADSYPKFSCTSQRKWERVDCFGTRIAPFKYLYSTKIKAHPMFPVCEHRSNGARVKRTNRAISSTHKLLIILIIAG